MEEDHDAAHACAGTPEHPDLVRPLTIGPLFHRADAGRRAIRIAAAAAARRKQKQRREREGEHAHHDPKDEETRR
jgi:hypothetical protein